MHEIFEANNKGMSNNSYMKSLTTEDNESNFEIRICEEMMSFESHGNTKKSIQLSMEMLDRNDHQLEDDGQTTSTRPVSTSYINPVNVVPGFTSGHALNASTSSFTLSLASLHSLKSTLDAS